MVRQMDCQLLQKTSERLKHPRRLLQQHHQLQRLLLSVLSIPVAVVVGAALLHRRLHRVDNQTHPQRYKNLKPLLLLPFRLENLHHLGQDSEPRRQSQMLANLLSL